MQTKLILNPRIPHNIAPMIPQKLISDGIHAKNVTIQGWDNLFSKSVFGKPIELSCLQDDVDE